MLSYPEQSEDTPWLRLSLLQHYAYCPSQARLIHEGVWTDNHLTAEGDEGHGRVDRTTLAVRRGVRVHHRVSLVSRQLRLYGYADAIEEDDDGQLTPVEHKRGRGAGSLVPTVIQVAAQALCLEEMTGRTVSAAAIYLTKERRRVGVAVDEHRDQVRVVADELRRMLEVRRPPAPIYSVGRCASCSIKFSCQPLGSP